ELDPLEPAALEGVSEEQVLRLDVRARAPLASLEPGPADLGPAVERLDVPVPGPTRRSAVDAHDERAFVLGVSGNTQPTRETKGVHVRIPVDLRLPLGRLA